MMSLKKGMTGGLVLARAAAPALIASHLLLCAKLGAEDRPNVLLILTDDQGYHDMSIQGATDFETPNLDRLALSGARFTDGYVTSPQCAPSRAGLITGVSQSRFGFMDNNQQAGLPPREVVETISEQLKNIGYTTGVIGKWHIGYMRQEEGGFMTLPGNQPWERGFDFALLHEGGMAHYFPYRTDGKEWMTSRQRDYRYQLKRQESDEPEFIEDHPADCYMTDFFSDQAVEFIQRNQEEPWFLFLSYNAPHTPMVAKPDKLEKYAHIEDSVRRRMVAMMDSVDEGVGSILDALEELGQTNRTMIWFLSDNGAPTHQNASRNDPLSGRKGDMHEGGIRVPFLVSWPGTIPAGQVLRDPVISLDILPTSLTAAGVRDIPAVHDGQNLLPWLKGDASPPNEKLFWSWRGLSAVRIGTLKETRSHKDVEAVDGTIVPAHVFSDLKENPAELPSKASPGPEQRQVLSERLDRWLDEVSQDREVLTPGF